MEIGFIIGPTPLKYLLRENFSQLELYWPISAPPSEHSTNVKERTYWLRLKHIFQEVVHQLRLIQAGEKRQEHSSPICQYDPVEIMYKRLLDLWKNNVDFDTLDTSVHQNRWEKIQDLMSCALKVLRYERLFYSFDDAD